MAMPLFTTAYAELFVRQQPIWCCLLKRSLYCMCYFSHCRNWYI